MKNFKIQSVSNIITNSSSEVFMAIDIDTVSELKKVITDLLLSVGINENIDDILTIEYVFSNDDYITAIKKMITTGMLIDINEFDINDEIDPDDVNMVSGYPVCENESEITPEIFEKALFDYKSEASYYEYGPIIENIRIKSNNDKYADLVKNLNRFLHAVDYAIFNT